MAPGFLLFDGFGQDKEANPSASRSPGANPRQTRINPKASPTNEWCTSDDGNSPIDDQVLACDITGPSSQEKQHWAY